MSKKIYVLLAVCVVLLLGLWGISILNKQSGSTSVNTTEYINKENEDISEDSSRVKQTSSDLKDTTVSDQDVNKENEESDETDSAAAESYQEMEVVEELEVELEEGEAGGAM